MRRRCRPLRANAIVPGRRPLDWNRIQIAAGTENLESRAIPERLGFKFEGVLRARENLYGTFIDHAMYALLRSEFDEAEEKLALAGQ